MFARPLQEPAESVEVVRDRVMSALSVCREFGTLPPDRQKRLADDLVAAGDAAARAIAARHADLGPGAAFPRAARTQSVEFPTFVGDVISGTFGAIVDASIRQMEAYAELLRNVAKSTEDFMRDNDDTCDEGDSDAERLRRSASRQQVLSTMVLMGINRIVVTDGKISASTTFELEPQRRRS